MKKDKRFEYWPISWFKRRVPTEVIPQVVGYNIIGFQKVEKSTCIIEVEFDNGNTFEIVGIVSPNRIYKIGGDPIITHWGVSGVTPANTSVYFKYIGD
jgi:hypothetical protein